MTSSPLYRQDRLCAALWHGRAVPLLAAWGHLSTRAPLLMRLCLCRCLVLRQRSDWLSCGCLSMCGISFLSQVFYSACLPLAVSPNSCRSPRTLDFIPVDRSVLSCRAVSVLALLDATDTDKLGIYSTLWFFSLLLSPKVNLLSVCVLLLRRNACFQKNSFELNA